MITSRGRNPLDMWKNITKYHHFIKKDPCVWCGRVFPVSEMTRDHLTPRSNGGDTSFENIGPCCSLCNRTRGNIPFTVFLGLGIGDNAIDRRHFRARELSLPKVRHLAGRYALAGSGD